MHVYAGGGGVPGLQNALRIQEANGSVIGWLKDLLSFEIKGCGPLHPPLPGVCASSSNALRTLTMRTPTRGPSAFWGSFHLRPDNTGTLFRGNSVSTKATDMYMKLVGLPYLHATIGQTVRTICESKVSCEVDPTRLAPGDDTARNWQRLKQFTTAVWTSIADAVASMPKYAAPACPQRRSSVPALMIPPGRTSPVSSRPATGDATGSCAPSFTTSNRRQRLPSPKTTLCATPVLGAPRVARASQPRVRDCRADRRPDVTVLHGVRSSTPDAGTPPPPG